MNINNQIFISNEKDNYFYRNGAFTKCTYTGPEWRSGTDRESGAEWYPIAGSEWRSDSGSAPDGRSASDKEKGQAPHPGSNGNRR